MPTYPPMSAEERAEFTTRLANAATRLVTDAPALTIEQLAVRASRARDDLDVAGIAARERQLHEKRYLRLTRQADGMTRVDGLLDAESAAMLLPIRPSRVEPQRHSSARH